MQRPHRILIDLRRFLAAPLEDVSRTVQQSRFPLMDHRWMHAIFGCQLRHCALAPHGFQRHTGFEPRVMVPAFLHILISWFLEISRRQIIAYVTVRFSGRSSVWCFANVIYALFIKIIDQVDGNVGRWC